MKTGFGAKKMAIAGVALVAVVLLVTMVTGDSEGNRLTGKWSCSEMQIGENTYQPLYITLDFYDMNGSSGRCNVSVDMGTSTQTVKVTIKGNQLILTDEDGNTETYEIIWRGSASFTLKNAEGSILFTKK